MPKTEGTGLITDQERVFARLLLSGTMTDREAAEAAGLNPDTAADTKTKPRVRAYLHLTPWASVTEVGSVKGLPKMAALVGLRFTGSQRVGKASATRPHAIRR
jgi:hypothetical protein